jgi:hypothetical protein
MLVKVSFSSLKQGQWYEYLIRFVLGGAVTVLTGVISSRLGPSYGGIFLALPAIFCASATLIEKHEVRRKRKAGFRGEWRGKQAAALDAVGAALGSLGMIVFAAIFYWLVEASSFGAFVAACLGWVVTSVGAWWLWRRVRR